MAAGSPIKLLSDENPNKRRQIFQEVTQLRFNRVQRVAAATHLLFQYPLRFLR